MTLLNDLQRESGSFRYRDREITGHVGLHRITGFLDHLAVQQDIGIPYRHRGQLIEHPSRETNRGDIVKTEVLHHVVLRGEGDCGGRRAGIVEDELGCLRSRRDEIVGRSAVEEAVEEESAPFVGHCMYILRAVS